MNSSEFERHIVFVKEDLGEEDISVINNWVQAHGDVAYIKLVTECPKIAIDFETLSDILIGELEKLGQKMIIVEGFPGDKEKLVYFKKTLVGSSLNWIIGKDGRGFFINTI